MWRSDGIKGVAVERHRGISNGNHMGMELEIEIEIMMEMEMAIDIRMEMVMEMGQSITCSLAADFFSTPRTMVSEPRTPIYEKGCDGIAFEDLAMVRMVEFDSDRYGSKAMEVEMGMVKTIGNGDGG